MESGLQNVDINDIETIDVMKDASATAIYGSAGANGVILITTKSGKSGKSEVSYNGYVSFSRLGKKLDLLGVEDYVRYQYEFQALRGNLDNFANIFGGSVSDPDFYTGADSRIAEMYRTRQGIDWQDEVFGGNAVYHSHNVSISGGTERSSILASYSNNIEEGLLINTKNSRHNFLVKFNHKISDKFDFRTKVSYYINNKTGDITSGKTLNNTLQFRPVLNANASDDDSEDALQDAFCRLWTRKEEIHGEKQAEGLLSVAARNIRIDKIRARSTHPSTSLEGVDILFQEKDEESAISETYREVSRLVEERLSSRDRDILFRRDRDGWDFDEIAEHFGISEANARMIVSRARKTIREIYKERRQS